MNTEFEPNTPIKPLPELPKPLSKEEKKRQEYCDDLTKALLAASSKPNQASPLATRKITKGFGGGLSSLLRRFLRIFSKTTDTDENTKQIDEIKKKINETKTTLGILDSDFKLIQNEWKSSEFNSVKQTHTMNRIRTHLEKLSLEQARIDIEGLPNSLRSELSKAVVEVDSRIATSEAKANFIKKISPIDLTQVKSNNSEAKVSNSKADWQIYQNDNLVIKKTLEEMRSSVKKNDFLLQKNPELRVLIDKKNMSWEDDYRMVSIAYPELVPLLDKIEKDTEIIENKLIKESQEKVSSLNKQMEKIRYVKSPRLKDYPELFTKFAGGFCNEQLRNYEQLGKIDFFTSIEKSEIKELAAFKGPVESKMYDALVEVKNLNKDVENIEEPKGGIPLRKKYLEGIIEIVKAIDSNEANAVEAAIQKLGVSIHTGNGHNNENFKEFRRDEIIDLVKNSFEDPNLTNLMSDMLAWVDSGKWVIEKKK